MILLQFPNVYIPQWYIANNEGQLYSTVSSHSQILISQDHTWSLYTFHQRRDLYNVISFWQCQLLELHLKLFDGSIVPLNSCIHLTPDEVSSFYSEVTRKPDERF